MQERSRRILKWVAGLLVAGGVVCLWGWRYGFTRLPVRVTGVEVVERAPAWGEVGTGNCWYWFRELWGGGMKPNRLGWARVFADLWGQGLMPTVDAWGGGGAQAGALKNLGRGLVEPTEIGGCFRGVLGSTDRRMPLGPTDWKRVSGTLLGVYPLVLAATAEAEGDAVEAIERLVQGWEFQACLVPASENAELFDERGVEQLDTWLVKPWCRLVHGVREVPPAAGAVWMERLERVAGLLPKAEDVYRRVVGRSGVLRPGWEQPDWGRVHAAFRVAGLRLRQEWNWVVAGLIDRLFGGRRRSDVRVIGARHLWRPLVEWVAVCQAAVARPEDCWKVREAAIQAAIESVRNPESSTGVGAAVGGVGGPPGWLRRWLDRPAAWRGVEGLPEPGRIRGEMGAWWLYLTECRLVLALRLYRDRYGRWPARLEEMVPEFLSQVPVNPFVSTQIGYAVKGRGWEMWREAKGERRADRTLGPQGVMAEAPGNRSLSE